MNSKDNLNIKEKDISLEQEIDLISFFNSLLRNKKLIAKFSILGIFIGLFLGIYQKKIWQGEFQIVLENQISDKFDPLSTLGQGVDNNYLQRLTRRPDRLKTEVGILKSPSVLMQVFDFVKKNKTQNGNSSFKKLKFKDWEKEYLDIELEKNTSILNIAYRDNDKDLIINVLRQISNIYQEYSGKKRLRNIELGINYFENQIKIFEKRSIESFEKLNDFGIKNDLTSLTFSEAESEIFNSNLSLESRRLKASNQIKLIDFKLNQLKTIKDDPEEILYMAKSIQASSPLIARLVSISNTLALTRDSYKEDDISVKNLLKTQMILTKQLKNEIKQILLMRKGNQEANLFVTQRPKEVLVEYQRLKSQSFKDSFTLSKLENNYREILLEKARTKDPWELITTPTLLPDPISPKIILLIITNFLIFSILGIIYSIISEKRKDIVFSRNKIESLTNWPLISELDINNKESWVEALYLLISEPISFSIKDLAVLIVGISESKDIKKISQYLLQFSKEYKLFYTSDIKEALNYSNILIVCAYGKTKYNEINSCKKKINYKNKNVLGYIFIKE